MVTVTVMADGLRIGLRFDRRDARALAVLADRAKRHELGAEAHATFSMAADAARTGEPLIVICSNLIEAALMVAGYVRYGIREPVLEQLD